MVTIRNFTNTKCELEIAKARLNLLIDRKNELYCKYFPLTSKVNEVVVDSVTSINDKMSDYLHELHEIDLGTSKSLADEITYQQKQIKNLQECLTEMEDGLHNMSGIEYQLFYEIVVNGTNISKAVDIVSQLNNKDNRTIWKYYYPKIKKDLRKISKFSNVQ